MLNTNEQKTDAPVLTQEQLAQLGEGVVAYLKPMRAEDASHLFPGLPQIAPGTQLFALLGASGKPLILTDSKDAALANALQNELHMVSVH
jgi:hypothetical protein